MLKDLDLADIQNTFQFSDRASKWLNYHGNPPKVLFSHPKGVTALRLCLVERKEKLVLLIKIQDDSYETDDLNTLKFRDAYVEPADIEYNQDGLMDVHNLVIFRVRMFCLKNKWEIIR
ncbi:hypothetical protein TorRG33x02_123090 [Trema orientale]|uniref:Uncharacterized protein n=1 Tax=Trema orientale TaxID=63057 RepID=A0A2P5F2G1_TREOI|nr:hypothetical protein TorRG33x02_123090 [Trema orientale]